MNDIEVRDEDWMEGIKQCYQDLKDDIEFLYPNNSTETFLSVIWNASISAFDIAREVQVLIDADDELYISVGTPGFVSFANQEGQLPGMKLPIKCWVHTHPFGTAFWSGTDWKSLKTWKPVLKSAIVLGDNEYLAYDIETEVAKKVYYGTMSPPESIVEFKSEEAENVVRSTVDEWDNPYTYEEAKGILNGDEEE